MNWRTWASNGVNTIVEKGLEQSSLPDSERQEVLAVVNSFTGEFEAGDVSVEDFFKVIEQLGQSPVMPAMIVMGIEESYISDSELTDEEKADGSKQLSRFVRGVAEGTISQTKIDDVTEPIHAPMDASDKVAIHAGNFNVDLKNPKNVTADELRAFLANAKAEADAAEVPDEKVEIDWSDELQLAIDRALGRAPQLAESDARGAADDDADDADDSAEDDEDGEDQAPDNDSGG
ncbi:MAG: hypothetical protein ACF8LK_00205 [Phycisphaerales bacterium JB041]